MNNAALANVKTLMMDALELDLMDCLHDSAVLANGVVVAGNHYDQALLTPSACYLFKVEQDWRPGVSVAVDGHWDFDVKYALGVYPLNRIFYVTLSVGEGSLGAELAGKLSELVLSIEGMEKGMRQYLPASWIDWCAEGLHYKELICNDGEISRAA